MILPVDHKLKLTILEAASSLTPVEKRNFHFFSLKTNRTSVQICSKFSSAIIMFSTQQHHHHHCPNQHIQYLHHDPKMYAALLSAIIRSSHWPVIYLSTNMARFS